jgi:hypothetical protein
MRLQKFEKFQDLPFRIPKIVGGYRSVDKLIEFDDFGRNVRSE